MATPEPIQTDRTSFSLWARRAAAALIAVVFLPIAIFAITFSGVRASVSEPDDLIEALNEADFYSYMHDHLVPSALDELFQEADHDVIRVAEPWNEDVAFALRTAFPAGEIRQETENVLRAAWPYLWGREDEFEVVISVAPRAARGFDELSRSVSRENPDVYDPLIELLEDRVEEESADYSVTSVDMGAIAESHLSNIAPSDWLFPRIGQAVDDVGAYYIGETENSEITIPIDDRAWAVQNAIIDVLTEADIDDASLMEAVVAGLNASMQMEALFVPGYGDVDAELVSGFILDEISPDELSHVKAQVIQDVSAYAVGLSDEPLSSDVELSLAQARIRAPRAIAAEADSRLEAEFNAVPACPPGQTPGLGMPESLEDILPACVIPGMTFDEYQLAVGLDAESIVREETQRMIPPSISINSVDVQAALDTGEMDLIERVMEIMAQGVTADAANLTAALSEELYEDPDQLRENIRAGFTLSNQTVENAVGEDGESPLQNARDFLASTGFVQIVLWALAAMVLFLLAFVGGRGWEGRLTWASIVLGIGAILAWLLATVPLDLIVRPALEAWTDEIIADYTDDAAVELVMRVETFVTALLDAVSERVKSQAIRVGVVAGVALVIARLLAPDSVGRRPAGR